MQVLLSNRGNPDFGQDPNRPVYGTPNDKWAPAESIESASALCRAYIAEHDLGGGNWTGGVVVQTGGNVAKGVAVAGLIAYNGRFFPVDEPHGYGKPTPIQQRAVAKLNGRK